MSLTLIYKNIILHKKKGVVGKTFQYNDPNATKQEGDGTSGCAEGREEHTDKEGIEAFNRAKIIHKDVMTKLGDICPGQLSWSLH
jgi:hypothetical protein